MPAHPPASLTSKLLTLPEATLGPPSPSSPPPSPSAVYQPSMGSGSTAATQQGWSSGVNCDRPSKAVGFPPWLSGKESTCQCRRRGFDPWVGKMPWRRKWRPTPVFLSAKFRGQRSLVGYSTISFHRVSDAIQPPHPLLPTSPLALNLSQHQSLFQRAGSLHHLASLLQSFGALASVYPMNIQG